MDSIAVIITSHNRKTQTLNCLHALLRFLPLCDIYLTNDGCTDGTPEIIKEKYPQIHIINGDGNLFWSRGMYVAWKEATTNDYDYYLWLNDDIELYPFFLKELMECEKYGNGKCIISGLVEDENNKIIYVGTGNHGELNTSAPSPQSVTYMNGNVVLVPKSVVKEIGIIDPFFHHDWEMWIMG